MFPPLAADGVCGAGGRPSSIRLGRRITARAVLPIVAPGAPTSLSSITSGSTVALSWAAPAGGEPPTSYVLEAGSSAGLSNLANTDTGSTATSLTATNVPSGTYFVRIRARNASGTSGPSNEIIVTVSGGCSSAPGAPTSLTAAISGSSVTLTWQAPVSGCAPTSYAIEAGSGSGQSNLASFSTGSASTAYSASGVPGGTYFVRVRASNAGGTSAASSEIQVVIGGCPGAPSAPANLLAQVSGTLITLSWSAAAGSPASYILEAGSSPGLSDIVVSDTGSLATSLTMTAGPGTYYLRVRARNSCGTSAASTEVAAIVGSSGGCATITRTSANFGEAAWDLGSIDVVAPAGCAWTALSSASFITIKSGFSGEHNRRLLVDRGQQCALHHHPVRQRRERSRDGRRQCRREHDQCGTHGHHDDREPDGHRYASRTLRKLSCRSFPGPKGPGLHLDQGGSRYLL